ncbi:MAG: peptidylprolyl isomerase [Deltaproteobacteria bacterium]|jgi:peptidylprolyl isomerase|nr:peptidylprolyl isomerase [Deltaproteobacteria bacterium]
MPVKNGDTLKVHYRGTLDDGTEFDSSRSRQPLEFTLGRNMLIPGFEKAVLGLEAGDKTTARIPPAEAYGEKDEKLIFPVPLDDVPADLTPAVGLELQLQLSDGNLASATISKVTDQEIYLDANPRLAGETLTFEIEVVEIS